jgi:hypothetical protein
VKDFAESLADQALTNLVNQFARPLDFLRELVQNSIDAGSPRVAIWLSFERPKSGEKQGVLEIHVDDSGEGMDRRIIDEHLTRLFSSSKEDDLTKIGKFGIGFTSIFAIQPQAVLLQTGRHGESWEVLFHADRSFQVGPMDQAITGTRIILFKRMIPGQVPAYVRDCRWILGWWCEHSDTPVTFWDRTQEKEEADPADPFAAFSSTRSSGPEQVNAPLELKGALLDQRLDQGRVSVIVGTGQAPRYAFYNGGLTLLSGNNPEVLGGHAPRLRHLSFKLKCDALEHTLTRDNVIQDGEWSHSMRVLVSAADQLRESLIQATLQAVEKGQDLEGLHRALTQEVRVPGGQKWFSTKRKELLFSDHNGKPLSMAQIERQEGHQGAVLLEGGDRRLCEALDGLGVHRVRALDSTCALLEVAWQKPLWAPWAKPRVLMPVHQLYLIPDPTLEGMLDDRERLVFGQLRRLLERTLGRRVKLLIGDFGGPIAGAVGPIALEGPGDGEVFQRPETSWLQIPTFLRRRVVLLNRYHPSVRLLVTAGAEALDVSSFGLAQLILHHDGLELESVYQTLLHKAFTAGQEGL